MATESLVFNGVNGATGEYLRPPIPFDQLSHRFGAPVARPHQGPVLAPLAGIDPTDLGETGWGVIFAPGVPAGVQEALRPLLEHRRAQASRLRENLYRELSCKPEETAYSFLARHGKGPGPADPEKMPYYLLIVGGPEEIPFHFQYQLDVQHGVGRLWLETPEDYARYAENVVSAETRAGRPAGETVFFAPENPDDPLTRQCVEDLVLPLAQSLTASSGRPVKSWVREEATKDRLAALLGGAETPDLLFTVSHGLGFWETDPRQEELQGSLLCREWPGPLARTISGRHFFSARDVAADARLQGLVSFHLACYSAGTPRWDSFSHLESGELTPLAPRSFLAGLPRKLLSGGALAVIGHVDQVWPCSFFWQETGPQRAVFESALLLLMQGQPVGAAMEHFGQRYAEIAAELALRLEPVAGVPMRRDFDLAALWLAGNDARSYVVCGDPAARLPAPPEREGGQR